MTPIEIDSFRGKLVLRLQIFLLLFIPILLTFSHRSMILLHTFVGCASLLVPGIWGQIKSLSPKMKRDRSPAYGLMCFGLFVCAYSALSLIWAPQREDAGAILQLLFFVIFATALSLHWSALPVERSVNIRIVYALGVIFAVWLLSIEAMTLGWLRDIIPPDKNAYKDDVATARGIGIAIFLAIPVTQALLTSSTIARRLKQQGRLLVLLTVGGGLLLCVFRFDVTANLLALFAAVFCAIGAYFLKALFWRLLILFILACLISAPFLGLVLPPLDEVQAMEGVPASWLHRFAVWGYTVEMIFASPMQFIFGGGVQYSAYLEGVAPQVLLPEHDGPLSLMISHPHNVFLQIWLEFGLIGVAVTSFGLVKLFRYNITDKLFVPTRISWCALIGALFVFTMVEANIWSYWRWAGPVLALIMLQLLEKNAK